MDQKNYCGVCKIFCGDATGILLHMISEEHHKAYQSYLRQHPREETLIMMQKYGNSCGTSHQIGSNTSDESHKDISMKRCQTSPDEISSTPQRMFSCIKNGEILPKRENSVLCFSLKDTKKDIPQIVVTGLSCSLETVWKSFAEFGWISKFQIIGGIACITYLERSSVDKLIHEAEKSKIIVNKIEFKIEIQVLKRVKGHNVSAIPDTMKNMFSSSGNFVRKMQNLMLETELESSERARENQVCSSIVQCLHEKFRPVAHPFGSRVAGLGTKTSDLDIYLEITSPHKLLNQIKDKSNLALKTLKSIVYNIGGLLNDDEDFSNIVNIPKASTAIVKCVHKPTGISCDLSFQAPYGVFQTSIIFFYTSLDYRVKPLLLFIRFWARVHGFSGINKFHNYTLSLLVIFFLQQISILPSTATLISNTKESEKNVVGFWECGFSNDISLLPKIKNSSSFLEVLKGFFQFYSEFDFRKYVVSPYLGVAVEKSLFAHGLESVYPTEFTQYISSCKNGERPLKVTECCVQDLLVHNNNVAVSIGYHSILHNFITFCNLYAKVCDSIYEDFMLSSDCDAMLQEVFMKS